MKIFVSYASKDRDHVLKLVEDLRDLDHEVWFDQELKGGQQWWEQILQQIRDCELFVFALTQQSLDSKPCELEYHYASALAKRILPVLLEDVNLTLLPPELVKIQFVDYRQNDKRAALALNRSLNQLPPYLPLPAELPDAPPVPVSPLNELAARLNAPQLSADEQRLIFSKLSEYLHDPESEANVRNLLLRFRRRDDLLAKIDRDIQVALDNEEKRILPRVFVNHGAKLYSARFLPDGKRIIAGYRESTLKIWDLLTGEEIDSFVLDEEKDCAITWLVTANDGKNVVGLMWDTGYQAIFNLNIMTGRVEKILNPPDGYFFNDITISSDNSYMAVALYQKRDHDSQELNENYSCIIYGLQSFREIQRIIVPELSEADRVLFSPDGSKLTLLSERTSETSIVSRIDFIETQTWQPTNWWNIDRTVLDIAYLVQDDITTVVLLTDLIYDNEKPEQILFFCDGENGSVTASAQLKVVFEPASNSFARNRLFIRDMPSNYQSDKVRNIFTLLEDGGVYILNSKFDGLFKNHKLSNVGERPIAHSQSFFRLSDRFTDRSENIVDVYPHGTWLLTNNNMRGTFVVLPSVPNLFGSSLYNSPYRYTKWRIDI